MSDELDAWACDNCGGDGWYWKTCQVAERKTDTQELRTDCEKCDGLGYLGPDAVRAAASIGPTP